MSVETIEETIVTLTEAAAQKLDALMREQGVRETHALRVFVSGGGCSGLQYGMTFDNNPRPVDNVFEQHGLRIIIDPQSREYMEGSSIDFVDGVMGGGFHIENPNIVSSCGCGGGGHSESGGCGCGDGGHSAGGGCGCH
ncbi:MAG: Iron-sulfur cluster insertion protein ErpA [Chloroflexi bacterium ADurb.Bin325]|nr:MAG: Iron-sulfur cluster insertion protein ErpA [Chloroflexi bacterium ADurb.Bin325]